MRYFLPLLVIAALASGCTTHVQTASSPESGDKQAAQSPSVMTAAGGLRIVPVLRFKPRYPAEAQYLGTQGCVNVGFQLDAQGRPTHLQAWASAPNGVFDQTAIQTVAKWRFRVTDNQGRPTTAGSMSIGQVIRFHISNANSRATGIVDWICYQPPPRTLVVEPATVATGLHITKNEGKPVDIVHMPNPHETPLKNGWVDVKFCIDANGHVADAKVLKEGLIYSRCRAYSVF